MQKQNNQPQQTQQKGLKRNITDKFYTKPETVALCLDLIKRHLQINKEHDLIIEPSAGNGAFLEGIQAMTNNHQFYDLYPENDQIILQDYLLLETTQIPQTTNKIHVIGNPPFGRQSSLAIQFIHKSCSFCDTLSFILPKSFKKDSVKHRAFPLSFHLIAETDLPEKSFLVNAEEYTVETVFQIWEKKQENRLPLQNNEKPLLFQFVKQTDNPDFAVRRVGVNAGKIYTDDISQKSIQSHYFILLQEEINKTEIITRLQQKTQFQHNNTVGPRSISKPELIAEFNKHVN